MSYNYEKQKKELYSDEGQKMFISIRDKVHKLLNSAGCFMLENAIHGQTGDSWTMLACIDRLVEFGEIKEIPRKGITTQKMIFISSDRG